MIDNLARYCSEKDSESNKLSIPSVIRNRLYLEEPGEKVQQSEQAYQALLEGYKGWLSQASDEHKEALQHYLKAQNPYLPWWQAQDNPQTVLDHLFELLQMRITLLATLGLNDPNGLFSAESYILHRLLMLGDSVLVKEVWRIAYQKLDGMGKFEQTHGTLKALEELFRCCILSLFLGLGSLGQSKRAAALRLSSVAVSGNRSLLGDEGAKLKYSPRLARRAHYPGITGAG